jgi:hypothetical protein
VLRTAIVITRLGRPKTWQRHCLCAVCIFCLRFCSPCGRFLRLNILRNMSATAAGLATVCGGWPEGGGGGRGKGTHAAAGLPTDLHNELLHCMVCDVCRLSSPIFLYVTRAPQMGPVSGNRRASSLVTGLQNAKPLDLRSGCFLSIMDCFQARRCFIV